MKQAGKTSYFVGNWKSHKTLDEALEFLAEFKLSAGTEGIICPPFPYLIPMEEYIRENRLPISLGAQDISPFPLGAYTGAVAGAMLKDSCDFVIVGHSERRKYFQETNEEVARKVQSGLENKLTPIVCIDEPYLETQLNFLTKEELKQVIVAYEPLEAIGSGKPDTPEHAAEIAGRITRAADTEVPVLYGGSVTAENIAAYMAQPAISGVLVGGASLDPDSFKQLLRRGL